MDEEIVIDHIQSCLETEQKSICLSTAWYGCTCNNVWTLFSSPTWRSSTKAHKIRYRTHIYFQYHTFLLLSLYFLAFSRKEHCTIIRERKWEIQFW